MEEEEEGEGCGGGGGGGGGATPCSLPILLTGSWDSLVWWKERFPSAVL